MRRIQSTLTIFILLLSLGWSQTGNAETCGEGEPGVSEWTVDEDGSPLYHAVFTARGGTLACFELLTEQFQNHEAKPLPEGAKDWITAEGPMQMVTTWDTEFLPYALTFRTLDFGGTIKRTLKDPTSSARENGWRGGMPGIVGANENPDLKEGTPLDPVELYKIDPIYTLVRAHKDEVIYVWPDPKEDESDIFIERRYRQLGGYKVQMLVTLYNFSKQGLENQPEIAVYSWELPGSKKTGFFAPPANILEGMCMAGGDFAREDAKALSEDDNDSAPAGEAAWVATGTQYFIKALIARGMTEARCFIDANAYGVVSASLYRKNAFTIEPAEGPICFPAWYKIEDTSLLRCDRITADLEVDHLDLFRGSVARKALENHAESLSEEQSIGYLSVVENFSKARGAGVYPFEFYMGPKEIDRLEKSEVGLEDSINFWIVGFISKPMLYLLRWFHSLIPHWAVAIILLTLLVKLVLLPITQKSFAQMQRMGQLRPMMDELKKKYGKDKERLNQEMMSLYKREKINPLGGCLPMLLQMPIWIALYRTILSSVELFQAPMGLWIQDLSKADPYFVLPLLLGVSMFLQQRLTPTTMDNAQAKMMMYFMPIMFTVFMLFLPSGLNLYIFVNTLLSLVQQWYLRRKFSTPVVKPA